MRNVVFGINISVDGCYEHTSFTPNEDIYEYFIDLMHEVDLIVYGRKTYELMVPYWPDVARDKSGTKEEIEFAETLTPIDKVVFSRTLESAEGNTRIVRSGLEEEILRLKQQPGKKISVGGVSLRSQLTALGLVDEYHFIVHPAIVGKGKRLFEDLNLEEKLNLKLVGSKHLKSGCIALHYVKK